MCQSCWREYGAPELDDEMIQMVARHIKKVRELSDGFVVGAMHIVIEDWNLEDEWLTVGDGDPDPLAGTKRLLAHAMLEMTLEQRASALALAEGYF